MRYGVLVLCSDDYYATMLIVQFYSFSYVPLRLWDRNLFQAWGLPVSKWRLQPVMQRCPGGRYVRRGCMSRPRVGVA